MREVIETYDYKKFSFVPSNRDITPAHNTKLGKSVSKTEGNIQPIIVDKQFRVLDGQHRLEACEALGLPVSYLVTESNIPGVELMIELNINSRNWTLGDYLKHWIVANPCCSESYQAIREIADTFGFGVETALVLCRSSPRAIKAGEDILIPPRFHITARATSDFVVEYLRVAHTGLRSLAVARAIMDLESRLDIRSEVDPHCKTKWSYTEAIGRIHRILPEDGVSCSTKTLRTLLSDAYDHKKLKGNRLAI